MSSSEVLFDLRDNPIEARYIMLKNTNTQTWVSIKEVRYNTLSLNEITYKSEGFAYGSSSEHNDLSLMYDNDLSTYVWFDWHCEINAYVKIDLRQIKEISKIRFYQNSSEHPGDLFQNCSFYISSDNINYIRVGEEKYESIDEIEIALDNVKVRYVKVVSNVINDYGVCIREFVVE